MCWSVDLHLFAYLEGDTIKDETDDVWWNIGSWADV